MKLKIIIRNAFIIFIVFAFGGYYTTDKVRIILGLTYRQQRLAIIVYYIVVTIIACLVYSIYTKKKY